MSASTMAELARVAAEQDWPRLRVWRRGPWWCWRVRDPRGLMLDQGYGTAWPVTLAVGLAALETASIRMIP